MPTKPIAPDTTSADEYFEWRDTWRKKRRVMTWGEYQQWARCGDAFADHTSSNAFPGGLTIVFDNRPPIFGGYED